MVEEQQHANLMNTGRILLEDLMVHSISVDPPTIDCHPPCASTSHSLPLVPLGADIFEGSYSLPGFGTPFCH